MFLGLIVTLFLKVLLNSLARHLLLDIGDLAEVSSPSGQSETHNQVEQDDVGDEPPVERRFFSAALVVDAAPELELNEEHAATDEEVEAKEELRDLLQALGQLDELKEQQYEDGGPEEEN